MLHPDFMSKDSPIEYDIFFSFSGVYLVLFIANYQIAIQNYIYPQIDFNINLSPLFLELYN